MDELKISSKFMRTLVSKLLAKVLREKLGYQVDIQLNAISATVCDGTAHVHLDIDAGMNSSELSKIVKTIGLGE